MRKTWTQLIILTGALIFITPVVLNNPFAWAQTIEVKNSPTPEEAKPTWTYREKIAEAEKMLEGVGLYVGNELITYYEDRRSTTGSVTKKQLEDPEMEIALVILNKKTGDLKLVKIRQRGAELISPPEHKVSIRYRLNGIGWNAWNTDYNVGDDYVVIRNKYPVVASKVVKERKKNSKGAYVTTSKKVIEKVEFFNYSPYSDALHVPELVEAGKQDIKKLVADAYDILQAKGVKSSAYSGQLISDVAILKPEFFEILPLIEHADLTEFKIDPLRTTERVLVIFGANPGVAFSRTGSVAGARGPLQYTKVTYDAMRKKYPAAGIEPDFQKGTSDHLN
jgi:hypothetical protein